MRVLNIKETGKTRGGLISRGAGGGGRGAGGGGRGAGGGGRGAGGGGRGAGGGGAYYRMYFFSCLQVDGPIARGGLVSRRAYKRQFTVFVLSFEHVHLNKWH